MAPFHLIRSARRGAIVPSGGPLPDPIDKGVQDLECFAPIDQGEYECQDDQDSSDNFYGPHTNNSLRRVALNADASTPAHRLLSASFKGEASTLPDCQRGTGKSKFFVPAFSHELPIDSVCVIQTSSSERALKNLRVRCASEGMPIAFTYSCGEQLRDGGPKGKGPALCDACHRAGSPCTRAI